MRAFNETAGLPYRLDISVGSAPCTIGELDSLDIAGLMSEADGALYRMKRKKKGLI